MNIRSRGLLFNAIFNRMSVVLITGGTGLIGTALARALVQRGYDVILLSRVARDNRQPMPGIRYARWDISERYIDKETFSAADYIIHLAGAGVAEKRWTKKRKLEIRDSRVRSSALLVESLRTVPHRVKAVISASAIGWYGPDKGTGKFVETDSPAPDFLGSTCVAWEESIDPVASLGVRLVKLRTGIVLSREGGALKEFCRPLRLGIAAILGNGRQVVSWIHIDDLVQLYIRAIEQEQWKGVYNAVAPHPVTNRELVLELARARNRHCFIPVRVPSFILKLILGEMSVEVLKSATVSAEKIEASGYTFIYPDIRTAVTLFRNQ